MTTANTDALPIIYQDDRLVAINKPSGLLVHRSPIDKHETRFAVQLLRDQLGQYVYPVHRLDKPTSGVLLFALDADSARALSQQFLQQQVTKNYLAVVRGFCADTATVNHPLIDEDPQGKKDSAQQAKSALTQFQCLAHHQLDVHIETYPNSRYSLLLAKPQSGRRHQIRRHCKHMSHPIIGDAKHGRGRHNRYFAEHLDCPRLLLHASSLQFTHPANQQEIQLNAGLDQHFSALIERFNWQQQLAEASPKRLVTKL